MRCSTAWPAGCAAKERARTHDCTRLNAKRGAQRYILAASQAIIGSAAPIAFSLGALAGYYLLGADKSLATAPITGFSVGVALGALPAAAIIRRLGQRNGFMSGTPVTAFGGADRNARAVPVRVSGSSSSACCCLACGGAFVQQFRFAAADNAPPEFKARAISFVLAGGVITAILGPQVVIFTRELFAPVMFAGSFAAIIVPRGDRRRHPVLPARPGERQPRRTPSPRRPMRGRCSEIVTQPRFAVGARSARSAPTALMTFVMTGAPLAMVGCGFSPDEATLGISWHVMAMFGPSFFTGRLIHRFGAERIVAAGLLLLIGCAIVALSGIALWQFWTALILLGLGWNFGFIGATAIVADSYRPSRKGQGAGLPRLRAVRQRSPSPR